MEGLSAKKLHEAIEQAITEDLPFGRIDPFDFGSVQKRTYLMDLYKRSTVIQDAFDMKYRHRLQTYHNPKLRYLKNFEQETKKKYSKVIKPKLSDLDTLNTIDVLNKDIENLEQRLKVAPIEVTAPRTSHSLCKGQYNRFITGK